MTRYTMCLLAAAVCGIAYGAGPKADSVPNGYAIRPVAAANGLVLRASKDATVIDTAKGAVSLTLQAFGWGSEMQSPGTVTQANSSGQRLDREYATGIAEWLENTAGGLEQGFVVASRPAGAVGPLRIRLETGWRTAVAPDGRDIILTRGDETLTYAGLKSWDARGVEVASRMLAVGTAIEIVADDANAVYPVTVDPTLVQQQKVISPSGEDVNQTLYGLTVALSSDGTTALVGGNFTLPTRVMTRTQGIWIAGGSQLPTAESLALSGDGNTVLLTNQQAVAVYSRAGAVWSPNGTLPSSASLVAPALALSEDGATAVVSTGTADNRRVFLYTRNASGWVPDGDITPIGNAALFLALSVDKTTLVVGGGFFVDVYRRIAPATNWTLEARLSGGGLGGAPVSLSGDGNTLLFGASSVSNQPGAAYLYTRTGVSWGLLQTLVNPNPNFGVSAALSRDGSTAVVGSGRPFLVSTSPGSAYLYVRSGATFQLSQTLTPMDRQPDDAFGTSVAISQNGSIVLVGAPTTDRQLGAVYSYGAEAAQANPALFIFSNGGNFFELTGAGCTQASSVFFSGTPLIVLPDAACTLQYFTPEPTGRPGSRYVFQRWQDDNSTSPLRSITTPPHGGSAYYFAIYRTQYELTTVAGTGGTVNSFGFVDEGTNVSVSATPSSGYRFLNFTNASDTGTTTHTTNPLTVLMDRPRTVTANFERLPRTLVEISLAANVSVVRGGTVQLAATGRYSDNSTATLTGQLAWNSSNIAVATISPAGLATGVAVGSSNVTASLDGVTSNTMILTVTPPQLVSISITAPNTSLPVGSTTQFTATGAYSDGTTSAITSQVSWIALPGTTTAFTISSAGLATAVNVGTGSIQASLSGVTSNTVVMTATAPALVLIVIAAPGGTTLLKGATAQLTATGTYTNGTTAALTGLSWTSSNTAFVTVSSQGLATAVSEGTATITASLSGITSNGLVITVPTASPQISPVTIISKTDGTAPNERIWTIQATNSGGLAATNLKITGVTINSVSPPRNQGSSPLVTTAFPVAFPATTLNPGTSTSAQIRLVFPQTIPPTRISITIRFAADGGYTANATLNNQFR